MTLPDDLRRANDAYAETFAHGELSRPPRRPLAVLTCIDARIDPLRLLGLEPGDANVLRNAGARATDDVVRSLVVAQRLLGVEEVLVMGHSDCGLEGVTNEEIRQQIRESGVPEAAGMDFHPFDDVDEGVREAARALSDHPVLRGLSVAGSVYDVRTGRLREV